MKIVFFILAITMLSAFKSLGCIMINASNDSLVLIGNNEDYDDPDTRIWVNPSTNEYKYGGIYFGYSSDIQGGINEKGLVYDGLAAPYLELKVTYGKEITSVLDIMENCANVDEVMSFLETHTLKGYIENGQFMFCDKKGNSIIVEGDTIIRKEGSFQIATNFYQSQFENREIECERYKIARNLLRENNVSLELMKKVLAATNQETDLGATLYSNIYDPVNGKIYLYHFHNFTDEVVIDVSAYLKNGKQEIDMPGLFEENFSYRYYKKRYENRQAEKLSRLGKGIAENKVYQSYDNKNPVTPTEVILQAYFLANKGNYNEATSFLSAEVHHKLSKGFYKLIGGAEGGWDYGTNKRTLQEIWIIKEEIHDKKAKVAFIVTFKNGKKREITEHLIYENGHWKIN